MSIERGIVQVFSDKTIVDYSHPWAFSHKERSTGSGFAIELHGFLKPTKYILTNAHCVNDSSYTTVRRQGISQTFKAVVEAIGYEVDLAILSVKDDKFWENITILKIGNMPLKLSNVRVYGFPLGGHNISITQGVVNRVRIIPYFNTTKGIAIQIDAPINFGNSGGPALDDHGMVVGVAFAGEDDSMTQNMGYLIPGIIIEFFLRMVQKYKTFKGLCYLGLEYQKLHNPTIRDFYKLTPNYTGVLVSYVYETSSLHGILNKGDIIMKINDIPIDTDGTIAMRDVLQYKNKNDNVSLISEERVSFLNLVSLHLPDEDATMVIWRDGKSKEIKFKTRIRDFLVPILTYQAVPAYFIMGGLVFVPLTFMMLEKMIDNDEHDVSHLMQYVEEEKYFEGHQKLVLTEILLSEITDGFDNKLDVLESINDVPIKNLEHMFHVINKESKKNKFLTLVFENTSDVIILKSADVRKYSRSIAIDQIGISDIYYNEPIGRTSTVVKAYNHAKKSDEVSDSFSK